MTTRKPNRRPIARLALALALLAVGCGDEGRVAPELESPGLDESRAALVAGLDAWQAGRRENGLVAGAKPAVGVVDSARKGRPLLGFEVLGPLMVVAKARPFAVRLDLDAPRETITARYLVLGRDPLWVFRQDDFERMLHWEHGMDPEPAASSPAPPAADRP